ncbi:MAG TPA: hypothetical protein VMF06_07550 [Candidatus Limnocylindria bacterium]|nr:hypothetical protein [Candidatus Limnocylindria bacterium]
MEVVLAPEAGGVTSLARQIKLNGRAYPLFEVAGIVAQKPERFTVTFKVIKRPDGTVEQPLFVCSLDNSIWLSEADAAAQVLKKHFDTFYQTDKQPCDPPKGVWTLVAKCGMSGEVLGPPNYHGYQDKLRKLHAERYSRMPFEAYKNRVSIVKDEAIVKEWLEGQSFRFEYTTLNVAEPKKLLSMEEVNAHFREVQLPNLIKSVEAITLTKEQTPNTLPGPMQALLRAAVEAERRFPMRIATALSSAFAHQGLQFFKRDEKNKKVVYVAVSRPHYLDLDHNSVSPSVRKIIEYVNANAGTNRKQLVEAIAPTPPAAPVVPVEGAPAVEGAAAPSTQLTMEQQQVLNDLHWLVHQGHVLEFASGLIESAKKPAPRPPAPPKAPRAPKEAPAGSPAAPAAEAAPVDEAAAAAQIVAEQSEPDSDGEVVSEVAAPEAPAQS